MGRILLEFNHTLYAGHRLPGFCDGSTSFRQASELYDSGYSADTIRLTADEDLLTQRNSRTLIRLQEYSESHEIDGADDIAEIHAEIELENQLGGQYEVESQTDVYWDDTTSLEVDHLIIRDGEVVGFAETKNSGSDEALRTVEKQISTREQNLNLYEVEDIRFSGSDRDVEMSSETVDDSNIYTIGLVMTSILFLVQKVR